MRQEPPPGSPVQGTIHGKGEGCFLRTLNAGCVAVLVLMLIVMGVCAYAVDEGGRMGQDSAAATASVNREPVPLVADIPALVGKSRADVERVLGKPSSVERERFDERGRRQPRYWYRGDKLGMVFINGKADWFKVRELEGLPFSPRTVAAMGFPEAAPSFANKHALKWENLGGCRAVTIFPGVGDRVSFGTAYCHSEPQ